MRIRSTKPEFWRSERIANVSWDARLVLKGLESYVDDNGVGKDDLALIVADVFPRDLSRNPTGTLQKVSEAISELENGGLLWRYEVEGTNLLYVAFWESVQRIEKPTRGRFRRPDGTFNYRDSEIREPFPDHSRNTPGTLRPGTGEQGNRGTDKPLLSSDLATRATDTPREDVERICQHLLDRLKENGVKPEPTITKGWRTAARLLLDRDERTEAEVHKAIDWATNDTDFWASNIRSVEKLRKHFDRMRDDAKKGRRSGGGTVNHHAHHLVESQAALAFIQEQTARTIGAGA